ncbi:Light-sensor Protein kinase [Tulasnella sp. 419]|nr:Light-sensor Protein kinase [Tulasnella sp. 419]
MDTPDASASDQTPKQKRRKEYEGPEVFTITGWAEPQTEDENEDRIPWRCWCAAHRPSLKHVPRPSAPPTSASSMATGENERDGTEARSTHSSNSGSGIGANGGPPRLIVFEFELETDTENPLYPAPSFVSPGDGSPASGSRTSDFTRPEFSTATQSGGAGTGTPSGGTVTQQNDGNVIPNEATELAQLPPATPLTNAALQTLADETDTGPQGKELIIPSAEQEFTSPFTKDGRPPSNSSLSRGDSAKASNVASGRGSGRVGSNDGLGQIGQPGGLSGDNTWMPSLQDIHESTTSKSKPLKSLEKLRIGGFSRRMSSLSGSGGMSGRNSGGRMSRNSNISGRAGSSSRLDSPALLNQRDSGAQGRSSGGGKSKKSSGGTGGRTGGFHSSRSSMSNAATVSTMDVFAVLSEVMDQLNEANSLDIFLKVVVGVIKDLTQFHRVLVYQFDDSWNGQVVAELLDWAASHDLYMGLHFPASDIPPQARQLYLINKVRSLYDRDQPTSRMVARDFTDLEYPLDMTHCYLRAMSPIHLKYLGNMGVRASMSISITAFGQLWGLIACHSYGTDGMRVSFPVRQMLRLLSDAIGRNIERLSYAHRLTTRKLISTIPTEKHPTGYIMSNAEDLLSLFDADYGILVIGDGAKILGPNDHGREILIIAQYFRVKKSNLLQSTPSIKKSLPDLELPSGMDIIAGLLYVPLSSEGKDFLVLLRRGQMRDVIWAGKPHKQGDEGTSFLEPRKSFQAWGETVVGRCRSWTDEQVETAGVLALVYGKFIEVWREKETAVRNTKLANLLLTNASHEVRTPLNQIIGFLEMALEGPLDEETRKNLQTTHMASKSLLFTINDLLDLTKLETGYTTSFNEPFDLPALVEESVAAYRRDALSRGLYFDVEIGDCPRFVLGDRKKVSTIIANVTNNAVRYTKQGGVNILCKTFLEPEGLRTDVAAVEILISDTGIGIPSPKLEEIFQQFEQVEDSNRPVPKTTGLGLGLAVVARIVEQLKGQIRVESSETGSRFSLLLPFDLPGPYHSTSPDNSARLSGSSSIAPHTSPSEVESFVSAVSATHMPSVHYDRSPRSSKSKQKEGIWEVQDSATPIRSVKMDETYFDRKPRDPTAVARALAMERARSSGISHQIEDNAHIPREPGQLRVLVAEDDKVNARLIVKRLQREGHIVELAENGQEAYDKIKTDFDFDCILMDIQMPIMNGFEATGAIRHFEASTLPPHFLPAHELNGRIPIFAVTASLESTQRDDLYDLGIDGWILKPINWSRVSDILVGVTDIERRRKDMYTPEKKWENGGWLHWFAGNGPL